MEEADDETRFASHRGVDGVACEEVAEDVVLAVCRPAADLVARIKIAHGDGNTLGFEIGLDPFAQKRANVLELHVARGVTRRRVRLQEILPGAFGDGNDRVGFCEHSLLQGKEERVERKRDFGNKREIHVLACDRGARRDEAGVATHEFHEPDPAGHAACFGVRAIEHARGLPDGAIESEGARDESDVVVDGLGDADDSERVAPAARFLVEIVRAALRAVATDGEENVNATRDKVVHRDTGFYRAARGVEDGASFLMNAMDELRRDLHRLDPFCGIEPAVTAAKAKHLSDTVAVVHFEKERADDVVEAGAQAATRHNARARLFRVEEKFRTRAGQLKLKSWLGTDFDPLGDADIVADRVATCGGEAWLAESRGVHREKGGGLRFVEFEELVHSSSGGGRCGFQLRRGCVAGGFVGPAFGRAAGLLQTRWGLVRSNEAGFVAFIVGNPHHEPNTDAQSIRPTPSYDSRIRNAALAAEAR